MRVTHFLLLIAVTCAASWSTIATAESSVQTKNLVTDPHHELANEGHRYLKGRKHTAETGAEEEERLLGLGKLKSFFHKLANNNKFNKNYIAKYKAKLDKVDLGI
uniref:RxLR effector protein n=1 Tax=Phytophthora ramorum TaxID=164328 RepID=H3H1E5_PHYRM